MKIYLLRSKLGYRWFRKFLILENEFMKCKLTF